MGTHLYEHRAAPPRSRLAWLASVVVHVAGLSALIYVSWATFGGRVRRAPGTGDGVVLGLADAGDTELASNALAEPINDGAGAAAFDGASADLATALAPGAMNGSLAADATLAPAPLPPATGLAGNGAGSGSTTSPAANAGPTSGSVHERLAALVERARVTVFGAVGEGSRFVYLFDHSTSMAGAPLAAAKQQLLASLEALDSTHQFQVIFFNHEVQAWDLTGGQRRVPYASETNKRLAARFIAGVAANGGTERVAPLRRALAMNVDVVFFLTDADDAMPAYDVADVIERARTSGTAIACIEFGVGPQGDPRQNFLTTIAAETGGDYVYVDVTKLGGW
jgi:hypothetical protein